MRKLIFAFYLLSAHVLSAQIQNENTYLFRYIKNEISVDKRFELDTLGLSKKCEIMFISEDKYFKNYSIIPYTEDRSITFVMCRKTWRRTVRTINYHLIKPGEMRTFARYPADSGRFDITTDFSRIRILLKQGPNALYFDDRKATQYDIILPDGSVHHNKILQDIDTVLYVRRPDFVKITNAKSRSKHYEFYARDTSTIYFAYPKNPDYRDWCFDAKKTIVEINQKYFKEVVDTLHIQYGKCLYLRLDAGGTENGFEVNSLDYQRSIYFQDYAGSDSKLVNISGEFGTFEITLFGDGGHGKMILIIDK